MKEHGLLMAGWIIYLVLHSILAASDVKAKLNPKGKKWYRLIYSFGSTVGMIGLLFAGASLPGEPYFDSHGPVRYVSLMLSTFGVMTIQLAFRNYPIKSFLGFEAEQNQLKITGILKTIRHPIYAGIILITLGYFLFNPTLPTVIACVSINLYLPIGIYLEERKLIALFGEEYIDYRKKVPAIIPNIVWTKIFRIERWKDS